jgi:hypothetical protein
MSDDGWDAMCCAGNNKDRIADLRARGVWPFNQSETKVTLDIMDGWVSDADDSVLFSGWELK